MIPSQITRISDTVWEVPRSYSEGMRVPGRIYATEKLMSSLEETVIKQVANVAKLPGILKYSFCMPDGHWGYGFPIGGVAAMDLEKGVISPGGIGFDINCGMRLVRTNLTWDEVKPKIKPLVDKLFKRIPSGVGGEGFIKISRKEFSKVVEQGSEWCLKNGFAWDEDLEMTEDHGCMTGADSKFVSEKAIDRGYDQIGTLGSGNHYLEVQVVKPENIFDSALAKAYGIDMLNQVVIMFHCGSRGFGHQVATDYLESFLRAMKSKYDLPLIDRELSCAPFYSDDGQAYFSAMKCAVNMAFANRQVILHRIREVFSDVFGRKAEDLGMHQVYDVAHNIAKVEKHLVEGEEKKVLVHRKGATRAFGPGMYGIPEKYKDVGQPVIIGGSMETGSYLLSAQPGSAETFSSTAHGSGRVMSRHEAKKRFNGRKLMDDLRAKGIYINTASLSGLAEEAGNAYKDIDDVTEATELAGISKRVVRFVPVGNVKG